MVHNLKMKDKKILPFLPARTVKGKNKWYILYYQTNPETLELERFRPTYNINRIKNIRLRTRTANGYVDKINKLLPDGYPFTDNSDPAYSSINAALDFFEENKYPDICNEAVRPYKRLVTDIKEYVEQKSIKSRIGDFSSLNALGVMKYINSKRSIGGYTYNRYLKDAIVLFNFLKKFHYIRENPFSNIKPKKEDEVRWKKFTDEDKKIIAAYLKKHDYRLFLVIQLIHGCFIRPVELTRLKFEYFNFLNGTITLPAHATKNGKKRTVTIPDDRLKYFVSKEFKSHHPHFYVFGYELKPSPIQSAKDRMNKRHRKHLKKMLGQELLVSLDGYAIYSWKKTGISNAYRAGIKGEFIRQQCDHTTEKVTQGYNDTDNVNIGMKGFNDSLE